MIIRAGGINICAFSGGTMVGRNGFLPCKNECSDPNFFFFLNFGEHGSGGFSRVTFAAREKKKKKSKPGNLEVDKKKKAKMCSNVTQRPRGKRLHFDFSPVNS